MNKLDILTQFIKKYEYLPSQGSQEWLDSRKYFIGGSEISVLLGKNKYKKVNKLILERLGVNPFIGNMACNWGTIFEELIRNIVSNKYKCKIVETGSIKHDSYNLSYSPDGLGVVKKNNLKDIISIDTLDEISKTDEILVLFEFKCPHRRIPTGEVPDHYIDQPRLGMDIIDITNVSIFIEGVFRTCSYKDLKYNKNYNNTCHYDKQRISDNPYNYGFITVYADYIDDDLEYLETTSMHSEFNFDDILDSSNIELDINELLSKLEESNIPKIYKDIYDLGSIYNTNLFENLLNLIIKKKLKVEYSYNNNYKQEIFDTKIKYIKEMHNNNIDFALKNRIDYVYRYFKIIKKKIIGIIPYKLMSIYINPIYKIDDYIHKNELHTISKKIIDTIKEYENHNMTDDELKKIMKKFKI